MRAEVDPLVGLLNRKSGATRNEAKLLADRKKLVAEWAKHPWNYFTGKDVDGRPILWTKDESDSSHPVKPFPEYLEYLKEYSNVLLREPKVFTDKSRQMMATTLTVLFADWDCRFHYGRRWLLSKSTEDEAKEILRDKVRFPFEQMPEWLQKALPSKRKPEIRVEYPVTSAYILAVAQNVADREARGGTASGVIIDEAALQYLFPDILAAVMPMTSRIFALSTPQVGNLGAECFKDYIAKDHADNDVPAPYRDDIDGFYVRYNKAKNVTVIELDYYADPRKDAKWAAEKEASYPNKSYWKREFCRDWSTAKGDVFFPEFVANPEKFIKRMPGLMNRPVYRGWDFGYRKPACVWFQYDPTIGRVWLLRELLPEYIDTHAFRDLILYLSGQLPLEVLVERKRTRALHYVDLIRRADHLPDPPWFEPSINPIQFIDYGGHEATEVSAKVEGQHAERTDRDILAAGGINLSCHFVTPDAGEKVYRRLLADRPDGMPGLMFDPACRMLIQGFGGGLSYQRGTKDNPMRETLFKDGLYENLFDAGKYGIVNVVPAVEEMPQIPAPGDPIVYPGSDYRILPEARLRDMGQGLDIAEARDPWSF